MSAAPNTIERDDVKVEVMTLTDGALSSVDRASIDIQIATAKQYPRSVTASLQEAETLATIDEETAASMFYALPRGGKKLEGPSARLAEIMAYSWGNLRVDADIASEDKSTVTAVGTCFDLEKNVAIRVTVKRSILDKNGKRYNADMIGVTSNAAISIALRNCVFKVIPRSMVDRIYQKARLASIGKAGTITQKRQNAVAMFAKMGVTEAELLAVLDVKGMDDVGAEELITLRGLLNAIKEGEVSIETVFRSTAASEGVASLNTALAEKKKATVAPSVPRSAEQAEAKRQADMDGQP